MKTDVAKSLIAGLKDAVDRWNAWQPTIEQKKLFDGKAVKPIGEDLQTAFMRTGEKFDTPNIDQGAWELALAVDVMYSEFTQWINDFAVASDAVDPGGSGELWDAYAKVIEVATKRRPPAPPSIDILLKQGDHISTIAKKYGWWRSDGMPDTERVNREIAAKPEDREYDPSNWIHPRERRFMNEIERLWKERCERMRDEAAKAPPPRDQRKPSAQSISELAELPYMTVRNIAIKKLMSEEEVQKELDELGYVKTSDGFRRANERGYRSRADREPEWLSQHDPHDELGDDVNARIIAVYEDGGMSKPKSISDFLKGARELPVTPAKVAAVLREYKKEKESVA